MVYRVLISGFWNRGFPLYTEISSFQDVGKEGFHCIHKYRVLKSKNFYCSLYVRI